MQHRVSVYFHACEVCARQFELVPRKLACESGNPFRAFANLYKRVASCHCVSSDGNRQLAIVVIRRFHDEKDIMAMVRRMIRATFCLLSTDTEYKRKVKDFYSKLDMMKNNIDYLVTLPPYLMDDGQLHCAKCNGITSAVRACVHCCSPQGLKKCKTCFSTCIGVGNNYCIDCGARP
jgi:hypothetical protein